MGEALEPKAGIGDDVAVLIDVKITVAGGVGRSVRGVADDEPAGAVDGKGVGVGIIDDDIRQMGRCGGAGQCESKSERADEVRKAKHVQRRMFSNEQAKAVEGESGVNG